MVKCSEIEARILRKRGEWSVGGLGPIGSPVMLLGECLLLESSRKRSGLAFGPPPSQHVARAHSRPANSLHPENSDCLLQSLNVLHSCIRAA